MRHIKIKISDIADAYTTSDIIYKWDQVGISVDEGANGALPNFVISAYKNSTCDSVTNTGILIRHFPFSLHILILIFYFMWNFIKYFLKYFQHHILKSIKFSPSNQRNKKKSSLMDNAN